MAVNHLSRRDSNLIEFERVIKFTLKKLQDIGTPLANIFIEKTKTRIIQWRNIKLVHLIKYLDDPNFIRSKRDQFGEKIVQKDIENMLLHLWQRLFPNFELSASSENTDNTSLTNTNPVNDGQSLADEFAKFDDNSFESVEFNEILVSIRREMACFEANSKTQPQRFQMLLNALLTIKPTSTEPERAFSIMG